MKEDDTEHEKRRASTEKHKSMQDAEKKKGKRKNLERQVLEERRAKQRCGGEPKEESPDDDDGNDDDDNDDPEGMAARLDRVLQGLPQTDVSSSRVEASKRPQNRDHDGRQKETSPHRSCIDTPPTITQGRVALLPRPPQASDLGRRVTTSATRPLTRGCAAAVAYKPRRRASEER